MGTVRYMSPEVLTASLDPANSGEFSAFTASDMYSTGLVLWEVIRRTLTGEKVGLADENRLPYFDYVPPAPSFEEMSAVVCAKVG